MWLNARYANGRDDRQIHAVARPYSAAISGLRSGADIVSTFISDCGAITSGVFTRPIPTLGTTPAIRPCKMNERSTAMQTATETSGTVRMGSGYSMTDHAWRRMTSRGLSEGAVEAVLTYGRVAYTRGAEIHALGRREVEKYSDQALDLTPYEGVQVVCVPDDGSIMTVYRNHDLSSLRREGRARRRARFHF